MTRIQLLWTVGMIGALSGIGCSARLSGGGSAVGRGRDGGAAPAADDARSAGGDLRAPDAGDRSADGAHPAGRCASLSSWRQSAPFVDGRHVSHPLPSFASGGYYYVHTKRAGSSDDRVLYSAPLRSSGGLGPWQRASSDHGGGPHGFDAIDVAGVPYHFRNGHIARYRLDRNGKMIGDVELLERDVKTSFSGNRYVWDSAVYAALPAAKKGYVFHLGGFSIANGYRYKRDVHRSGLPIARAFTRLGVRHPASRPGRAVFFAGSGARHGYLFSGESGGARLWRARLSASGALSSWVAMRSLPAGDGNQLGDLFVARATLFSVRGAKVFSADIRADGSLSAWRTVPPLPRAQIDVEWGGGHLFGSSYGVAGGWVYLTGPKRVFYARVTPRACR